jgi:tRNA dimethylallyltransferase
MPVGVTCRRPIILAGPTASGKSALALRIAERDGGCVVNADASQVYGCWRVLTARPDAADLVRAPHALYGHASCADRYSVGAWLRDLAPVLADLQRRGLRPVIVGGTGLYLSALTEGLSDIPQIPPDVHARSEALLRAGGISVMLDALARHDPATLARIDRDNPMRVQRAWEVVTATGRGLSDWQRGTGAPLVPGDQVARFVIETDKPILNSAIYDRLDKMIENGALDECRRFLQSGLDRRLPSAKVLGASQFFAHLEGNLDLEEAVAAAAVATQRFAKRQRTWFRNRMPGWTRIDASANDPLASVPDR